MESLDDKTLESGCPVNVLLVLVFVSSFLFVNPISAREISDDTFRQLQKIDPYHSRYEPDNPPAPVRSRGPVTARHSPGSVIVGSVLKVGLLMGFLALAAWIYGRMKKKKGRSM